MELQEALREYLVHIQVNEGRSPRTVSSYHEDLKEYIAVKENVMADYEDRMNWAGKMLINTAKAGYFSSDRTIAEYNRDIWKL